MLAVLRQLYEAGVRDGACEFAVGEVGLQQLAVALGVAGIATPHGEEEEVVVNVVERCRLGEIVDESEQHTFGPVEVLDVLHECHTALVEPVFYLLVRGLQLLLCQRQLTYVVFALMGVVGQRVEPCLLLLAEAVAAKAKAVGSGHIHVAGS